MVFSKFAENVFSKNPVFVVGSGTSSGAGISGMWSLGNYLVGNVKTNDFEAEDLRHWEVFIEKISEGIGLEEALQSLGDISEKFTDSIVQATWNCILMDEMTPFLKISSGEDITGFSRLFKRVRSTNIDSINIITTNYDHLIEVSAAFENWEVWDGFGNGILSRPMNSVLFKSKMRKLIRPGSKPIFETTKHVKIYKPHGSLSWFKLENNSFIKIPSISSQQIENLKNLGIKPVIVTPGIGKYLETHYEPYNNVMAEMQQSIHDAKAMIFLGFGFNDIHIQASFQSILRNENIPKLIATRTLTPSFFSLIQRNELKNFYAIEKFEDSSRVISDLQDEQVFSTSNEAWSLHGLLNMIWGEE